MVLILGLLAGLLQVCGYIAYIRKSLSNEIQPNPSTWFMFSYGTASLTVLEWDRAAPVELLILPITCAVLSVVVAWYCWQKGTLRWPSCWIDRVAFICDLVLTAAYVLARIGSTSHMISEQERVMLVIGFLVCSNLSTLVSFIPLMRNAGEEESSLPWGIWSVAYATLAVTTIITTGYTELLIYPISNAIWHGLVAVLALSRTRLTMARS